MERTRTPGTFQALPARRLPRGRGQARGCRATGAVDRRAGSSGIGARRTRHRALPTEFSAAYAPPALMPGYQGHDRSVAFSLGGPYGTTSLKYFRDHRNAAVERSHVALRQGAHFPTFFSPNPDLALSNGSRPRDRWLHMPSYTRFNLDNDRSTQLTRFYQLAQQHRAHYLDKTGMVLRVPYFVLPVREWERYPIPTDLPPLSPKNKWHLLRVSPENLKPYQAFPSGKRVSPQERQKRDSYFEFRA